MRGETTNSRATRVHTADEAAVILKVTTTWLKEQARRRKVPFSLLSGSYRFSDRHLEQILEIFEQQPEEQHRPRRAPRKTPTTPTAQDVSTPSATRPLRARRPQRRLPSSG